MPPAAFLTSDAVVRLEISGVLAEYILCQLAVNIKNVCSYFCDYLFHRKGFENAAGVYCELGGNTINRTKGEYLWQGRCGFSLEALFSEKEWRI